MSLEQMPSTPGAQGAELEAAFEAQRRILRLAAVLEPRRAIGFEKIRIGGPNDGGYVMIDHFSDVAAAYSLGVGPDVSWDVDIAERGIKVYQFDHTVDGPPQTHRMFEFAKTQIVPETGLRGESLTSLVAARGHDPDLSLILKCDIEGDEWAVFDAAPDSLLGRFSQIVCEFHTFGGVASDLWYARAYRVLRKLRRQFEVVHVHANNYCPIYNLGNVAFPDLLEVTFVNQKYHTFEETDEIFPTPLDSPNRPDRPDIFLGPFRFGAYSLKGDDHNVTDDEWLAPLVDLDSKSHVGEISYLLGNVEFERTQLDLVERTVQLERLSDDLVGRTDDLVATRSQLVERTAQLEKVSHDLATRTDDLVAARGQLVERTAQFEKVSHDLATRTDDLVATRDQLVERTAQLEQLSRDLMIRTDDLVATRSQLVERTARLEQASSDLMARTDDLVAIRSQLVERTAQLETVSHDLATRTDDLVATREELADRTADLARSAIDLRERDLRVNDHLQTIERITEALQKETSAHAALMEALRHIPGLTWTMKRILNRSAE